MTPDEYIQNAVRTNAPNDKAMERLWQLNHVDLKKLLMDYVEICNKLDKVKKAIFYGKNFTPSNDKNSYDLMSHDTINPKTLDVFHGVIGICTESGEMVEALLKYFNGESLDIVNVLEEQGDIEWYQALIYHALNASMENTWEKNIAKLKARYPEKFTEEHAINRDLQTERKILEG